MITADRKSDWIGLWLSNTGRIASAEANQTPPPVRRSIPCLTPLLFGAEAGPAPSHDAASETTVVMRGERRRGRVVVAIATVANVNHAMSTVVLATAGIALLALALALNIARVRRLVAARRPIPIALKVAFVCFGVAVVAYAAVIGLAIIGG